MEQKDEVEKMSLDDKILAVGIIDNNYKLFDQKEFTEAELLHLDAVLYEHLVTRGPHSLKMTVRIGRAMKKSIENPLKIKETISSKFTKAIKGYFA